MVSHEDMVRELNEDFESLLGDMKPYVLQLQLKSERQRCALWIKKLCEPHQHSGLEGRKLRNSYSKALLNMLKRGVMEGPLLHRPPDGKLEPFPIYLSEYLEETNIAADNVPDWLNDLDDRSSLSNSAGDFGDPRQSSTNRRSTESHVSESRHAAREKLEELLTHQTYGESQNTDLVHADLTEDTDDYFTRKLSRPTNGSLRNHSSDGKLRSPNKKRSSLTVSFPEKTRSSPLDEITTRRTAAPAASFQFSSDEEDHGDRERRFQKSLSPPRVPQRQERSSSTDRWTQRSPTRVTHTCRSPQLARTSHSPVFIREQARQLDRNFDREVDLKVKVVENQLYEEKLKMQQKNDEEIQKILERKNSEIDEIKAQYKKKLETAEGDVAKLEKKVQTVLRDSQIVRDNKDLQISELKKMAEESTTSKNNCMEKRFHDLQTEHEQEKMELQKAQTASIQQLMDDTNERLLKMEDDYRKQSKAMGDTIRELEKRIQVLTLDAEKVSSAKQLLEQCKIELESRVEQLSADCSEYKIRYDQLERAHTNALSEHANAIELVREKHESQLNFARKEHQLTVSKDNDTILSLEQSVIQLKQNLQDLEAQRQRQVRELEQSHQQDRQHSDNLHDKKVRSLHKEMEQQESEHKRAVRAMDKSLADKEKALEQLQEKLTAQAAQADAGLQELRQQVEKQQEQVFAEMKQQMQQVEMELEKSKKARREQTDEFEQQVKEIAAAHEFEIKSARQSFEEEKQNMAAASQQQRDLLVSNLKQEMELLKKNAKAEKEQMEKSMKQRKAESEARLSDVSEQLHELKEELAQSENLRKQQLMEIGLVKEEETQRLNHEHERALERCRSDCEREKHALQKQHSADLEGSIEKTNAKLRNIENDYTARMTKQAEQVADLQLQLEQLQAEKHRLVDQLESKIVDNSNRFDEEKRSLRKQSAATVMSLKQEVEMLKAKIRQSERHSENLLADHEEDLVQLRLEYEEKMRGLIPSDAREQLDATVNSLKNQVNTLKQRIAILQDS
ncbi:centrosomal protein of 112 kDa-like [Watersipora subatra]|uniref:centrosomal protein of 112 kDa-like n=1 Tax=Watersipora subatra TaxID=2589382 RepID=UPI00355C7589